MPLEIDGRMPAKPGRNERAWKKNTNGTVTVRTLFKRLLCLTPLGSDIYLLCSGRMTIPEITTSMTEKYPHIPVDQLQTEIHNFLQFMESMGVLTVDPDNF